MFLAASVYGSYSGDFSLPVPKRGLEQPPLGKRDGLAAGDDHVVQEPDVHQRQGVPQAAGDELVGV